MIAFEDVDGIKPHVLIIFLIVGLTIQVGFAQTPPTTAVVEEPPSEAQAANAPESQQEPEPAEDDRSRASYFIPALEIIGFNFALNRFDHQFLNDPETFDVRVSSIRRNLSGPWVVDDDPFSVNQFLHPYHGSMYHTTARSAGVGFWPSTLYTFIGRALWEIAG